MANGRQRQGTYLKIDGMKLKLVSIAVCLALLSSMRSVVVDGAPILGPDLADLARCRHVIPRGKTAADAMDCCLIDTGKAIKDFKFNPDLPMRVRKPVHKVDEEFVRKYERAYELMRALPAHDPRSWEAQAKLHCSYCSAAYSQFNSSEILDVHHSWLFMPFHRWYLYFHERILASLLGDDTFATPYWAWDVQDETSPPANIIPSIFSKIGSPLFDPLRSHVHRAPHGVDLSFQAHPYNKAPDVLRSHNHYKMWRVMIGEATTPLAFYGGKFSLGDVVSDRYGKFEEGPHGAVHQWTGSDNTVGEDMGASHSGARDPLFFAHHSQIDRMWLMWKDLGGQDIDDPDWLDAEFLFYDENADMVRVKIRDCLDLDKLRISYEQVPAEWLGHTPKSIRETSPKYIRRGFLGRVWQQVLGGEVVRNIAAALGRFLQLGRRETEVSFGRGRAVVTSRVSRPNLGSIRTMVETTGSGNLTSVYDEVLVISGVVTKPFDVAVLFNLFLELPEADENTPQDCAESLGDVYLEREGLAIGEDTTISREFTRTIGIGSRFPFLNISGHNSVTVRFVPAWDPQYDSVISIRITELRVELQLVR